MSGECEKCGNHTLECECRGPGRPEAKINWTDVQDRLKAGSYAVEIAESLGISTDCLYNRCMIDNKTNFTAFAQRCKADGKAELRAAQYKKAIGKLPKADAAMLKHLGEWLLNQKEKNKGNESGQLSRELIIYSEQVKAANPQLYESLKSFLPDKQPLLDQGQPGESDQISDELGPEGII